MYLTHLKPTNFLSKFYGFWPIWKLLFEIIITIIISTLKREWSVDALFPNVNGRYDEYFWDIFLVIIVYFDGPEKIKIRDFEVELTFMESHLTNSAAFFQIIHPRHPRGP